MSCVLIVLSLFFKGLSVRDFFNILLVEFITCCANMFRASPISNVAFKVNADNGFAHRAASLGMEKLIPSAKENGISSLAITNSYNCGVLGYHTKNIAKEKF